VVIDYNIQLGDDEIDAQGEEVVRVDPPKETELLLVEPHLPGPGAERLRHLQCGLQSRPFGADGGQ